jgi:predicted amidophosphoribosyltransferase
MKALNMTHLQKDIVSPRNIIRKKNLYKIMNDFQFLHKKQEKKISDYTQQKKSAEGIRCRHCGSIVPSDAELCPECKYPVHDDHCTFCGASIFSDDRFCPECGNPVQGIRCTKCGTMNFRGFCYNCHEPLTENAQLEIEKTKNDPKFQQALSLAKKIEQLYENIWDNNEELSNKDRELINSYKVLIQDLENGVINMNSIHKTSEDQVLEREKSLIDLTEKITKLNQKITDLTRIFNSFEPDPQTTPQLQRDYCSARKIKIVSKGKELVTTGWKCNFCGYVHKNPEECDKPKLGGEWRYKEIEIDDIKWIRH